MRNNSLFFLLNEIGDRKLRLQLVIFFCSVFSIGTLEVFGIGVLVPFAAGVIRGDKYVSLYSYEFGISTFLLYFIASFWFFKALVVVGANYYNAMFIQEIKSRLQSRLLKKFISRTNRSVGSDTGELFARITNDIQMLTGQILTPVATALSEFILICVVLLSVGITFPHGLIILVTCVSTAFVVNQVTVVKIAARVGTRRKQFEAAWADKLTGALFSRFEATTYRVSEFLHNDILNFIIRSNKESGKFYAINPITRSLLEFSAITGLVISLIVGVKSGTSADILLFFMIGSARMLPGAMKIGYALTSVKFASSVVHQVCNLISHRNENPFPVLLDTENMLILQNLRSESAEKQIIDLSRPSIDIVRGPSGIGKSTWLSLAAMQLSEAKKSVGLVLQDSTLISGNMKFNVRFYRENISEKKILEVLRLMGLRQTNDFDVQHLSGGEKRRLMLARATVSNPEVLLLDEPTAGLDKKTQYDVMNYLKKKSKNCKVIMISHSEIDLEFADNILELGGNYEK